MKHIKTLFALILALVLVLGMNSMVFAEDETPAAPDYSITVNNAKSGETYTAYKMFDLSVDDPTNPTAFRYTVNSAWTAFADTEEFKAIFSVDEQGYITTTQEDQPAWSGTSAFSTLADKAAKYAKDNHISAAGSVTIAADATSGKIELTEAGYYVVSSTVGTRAMIESTPSNAAVTINEKNEDDTIDKQVQEGGNYGTKNDAQIGDTVYFKSIVTIAARSVNVKVHDTMDSGLTLNPDSIKLFTDEAMTTEYTAATVKTGSDAATGDTFTIEIPDDFAATATESQNLYISYSAEINSAAVVKDDNGVAIVDQNNKTKVTFGDGQTSVEKTTTTTTHKFNVFKHRKDAKDNLAGAVFTLKKGETLINLIKLDDNNYRVADDTETGTAATHANNGEINEVAANTLVSDFVTVASGDIVIWGVDSGSGYTITEIQAPKGYNQLSPAEKAVTVDAGNTTRIDVENNTGSELPSTGGIGRTIFYVVGGVIVISALILLVARRRMKAEK